MSDIQAGDVVVCVDDGPSMRGGTVPLKKGRHYRVLRCGITPACFAEEGHPYVALREVQPPSGLGYLSRRFRKIRPAEDEFTQLVRKMKPIKTRIDA